MKEIISDSSTINDVVGKDKTEVIKESTADKKNKKINKFRTCVKYFDLIMSLFKKYMLELLCMSFFVIFDLWVFGYLMNGLYGYKFDLASSVQAIGAISSAGILTAIKYTIDSTKNTVLGESPEKRVRESINRFINGDQYVDENNKNVSEKNSKTDSSTENNTSQQKKEPTKNPIKNNPDEQYKDGE